MKRYLVFIFCLLTIITVKADNPSLLLDCLKDTVEIDEKVSCELKISFNNMSISNISMDYDSNLNLSFIESNNNINNMGTSINVNYSEPLTEGNNLVILKVEGVSNVVNNSNILLKNIKINNDITVSDINKSITVNEKKVLSSNANVTDITIDNTSIENFSSTTYRYENIIVHSPVIFVDVKGKDAKATVTGVGSSFLRENIPTEIKIRVTSEDQTTNIYTLVVTYKKAQIISNDATLSTLELYNGNDKLDFSYNKDETSFHIKIDGNISKVLVKASLNNNHASFLPGYEPNVFDVDYGENIIELRTKSENGDTKIYKINIEREDNRNTDNTLKELKINNISVKLEKNKYNYDVTVDNDVLKTSIYAKATESTSKVEYTNINLFEGTNDLIIKVIAQNDQVKEYHVKVTRKEKTKEEKEMNSEQDKEQEDTEDLYETKKNLENIQIQGYAFAFQKNVYEYNLDIDSNVDSLSFIIEPKDSDVQILNNKNLTDNSMIIVRVMENDQYQSYTITVHKKSGFDLRSILKYGLLGIGVVMLATSIIILIKKKNK